MSTVASSLYPLLVGAIMVSPLLGVIGLVRGRRGWAWLGALTAVASGLLVSFFALVGLGFYQGQELGIHSPVPFPVFMYGYLGLLWCSIALGGAYARSEDGQDRKTRLRAVLRVLMGGTVIWTLGNMLLLGSRP